MAENRYRSFQSPRSAVEFAMSAHTPTCTDAEEEPWAWESPLTRLLLLLEIADEPAWLRDAVEARAMGHHPEE